MGSPPLQIGRRPGSFEPRRLPPHCQRAPEASPEIPRIERRLRTLGLHSVCEEARCPNRSHCWTRGHVTFLLLGSVCTRACRFCAVATGRPASGPDPGEPARVARASAEFGARHVVLTSVNRDDLADGGASQFAACVRAIRDLRAETTIEVLTPDFQGSPGAVQTVCDAAPDVFNHNVETVPRLYRRVRPGARFERSRAILGEASRLGALVKSGLMLGLGETLDEVTDVMRLLRETGVEILTLGQYLRPTRDHLAVERYLDPSEFDDLAAVARDLGFSHVASGPLVRSSFHAEEHLRAARA